MTQQFNLPPGMVEVADDAYGEAIYAGVSQYDAMSAALQAALGWAVKEGWARCGLGFEIEGRWESYSDDQALASNEFPAIILRLEEPKP